MKYKPPNLKFVMAYVTIVIALLSIDISNFLLGEDISNLYNSVFSVIFFLTLCIIFSASYITSRFKTNEGGVFFTSRLFLILLIVIYREIGLWAYIVLFFLSCLLVERRDKLVITYWCSKDYIDGFVFMHLFLFLNKDHPITLDTNFLIPYFSASIISYPIYIVDDYVCRRVHMTDQSKVWHDIIELRRAVIPNYLLSVFLAGIIIILFHTNNLRYLALALPIIISAIAIYRKFYTIYVEDRSMEIEGQV